MINKKIEEAKERLKYINMAYDCCNYYSRYDLDCIETLLQYIDQLEKKVKELEKYKRLAKANLSDSEEFKNNMCNHRCLLKTELYNSIPKEKVKEKIEELSNTKGDFATYIATSERIKVLQELMEEK